jgi:hypothetical protein
MLVEPTDRPLREIVAECDGCGRRLPLPRAGLVEDGAVLCPDCATLGVEADLELPAAS